LVQGDLFPGTVKFPKISLTFRTLSHVSLLTSRIILSPVLPAHYLMSVHLLQKYSRWFDKQQNL